MIDGVDGANSKSPTTGSEIEDACITIGANAGDIVFIADELQQKVQKPLEEKSTTSS